MKLFVFYIFIFLFSFFCKANSSEDIEDIKRLLEGRYELILWKQDNLDFKYPKISGTLVINNNNISFTLDNYTKEDNFSKIIGWGNYILSKKKYNYGYFDFKKMTVNGKVMKVNNELPWKGMREYSVNFENNKLVLISKSGKQTWKLDKEFLVYEDKEWGEDKKQVIRHWKRIY